MRNRNFHSSGHWGHGGVSMERERKVKREVPVMVVLTVTGGTEGLLGSTWESLTGGEVCWHELNVLMLQEERQVNTGKWKSDLFLNGGK